MPLAFDINTGQFVEIDDKKHDKRMVDMAKAVGGLIKGDKGDAGSRIHNGNGAPSADTGVEGDFYIDSLVMDFYGPKDVAWGSGVSLLGRDGISGKDGIDGKDGRDGIDGRDGAPGKDGANGIDGKDGAPGRDGVSAQNIELQSTPTHVQFRHGNGEWRDLFKIPKAKTVIGGGGGKSMANIQAAIAAASGGSSNKTITVSFGDGINVPTVNTQSWVFIPEAMTVTKWTMLADASGSAVIDVWVDTYANYPPTVGDKITASAPPTLSGVIKNQDSTLTGWDTAIAAGEIMLFNLDSVTTCKKIVLAIELTPT